MDCIFGQVNSEVFFFLLVVGTLFELQRNDAEEKIANLE